MHVVGDVAQHHSYSAQVNYCTLCSIVKYELMYVDIYYFSSFMGSNTLYGFSHSTGAGDSQTGGEGSEEERFVEWLERLEMVASMCGWSEQAMLVTLIMYPSRTMQ